MIGTKLFATFNSIQNNLPG